MKSFDLIAKHLSGNLSENEKKDFLTWRQQPGNEAMLAEYEKLWASAEVLNQSVEPDTDQEWEKFKMKIQSGSPPVKQPAIRPLYRVMAAASVAVLLAAGGIFVYYSGSPGVEAPRSNDYARFMVNPEFISIVAGDSIREVYLPDSSLILLNQNARLSYLQPFGKKERITYLTGEAFFDVRKDGTPFVVYAGGTEIRVVGTAFNIRADRNEVEVSVVEGSVTFREQQSTESSKILLQENDQVTFNRSAKQITRSVADNRDSWWTKLNQPVKFKWHEIDLKQEIDDWRERLKSRPIHIRNKPDSD